MSEATPTYSIICLEASKLPEQYIGLVYSKWLRSQRFGNPVFKLIDSDAYYQNYHAYITQLLAKPESVLRLAVLTDDPDVVLGFSLSRGEILDYVHVQADQRMHGVGSKLLPPKVRVFTHITTTAEDIWNRNPKYRSLKFNPFA